MGQGQHHRALPSRQRGGKSAGDHLGHAVGLVDFRHPFGQAAEEGAVIHFLKGVAAAIFPLHLAHEQDHGGGILRRDMDAAGSVGGAGPAGDKTDAGPPGLLAMGFRHHGGAAFVAADDDLDAAVIQRVQHRQIGFARHAEDAGDALDAQLIHQHLCGGAGDGVGMHGHPKITFSV